MIALLLMATTMALAYIVGVTFSVRYRALRRLYDDESIVANERSIRGRPPVVLLAGACDDHGVVVELGQVTHELRVPLHAGATDRREHVRDRQDLVHRERLKGSRMLAVSPNRVTST